MRALHLRHALVLGIIGTLALGVTTALAQTGTARGEALFKQGVELKAAGKLAEACDAFDASEKADPNLGTLMYLADCREANQELTSAWAFFLEAEQRTRNATDDESVQINKTAKERAARLEPRLSKLTLIVSDASRLAGLEILVGEDIFNSSSWNLEVPVDGKTHTITARAPGRLLWTTQVVIGIERDTKTVAIPPLAVEPVKQWPVSESRTIIEIREQPSALARVLPYVLTGTGVVLVGTGIWFEVLSSRRYDQATMLAEDKLQTEAWERAKSLRYRAIGLSIGGLACGGAAAWLWLRAKPDATPSQGAVVQPVVGSGYAGLQVGGAW